MAELVYFVPNTGHGKVKPAAISRDPSLAKSQLLAKIYEHEYVVAWSRVRKHPITLPPVRMFGRVVRRGRVVIPRERKKWPASRLVPTLAHELAHVVHQVSGEMGKLAERYVQPALRLAWECEGFAAGTFAAVIVGRYADGAQVRAHADRIAEDLGCRYVLHGRENRGHIIAAINGGASDAWIALAGGWGRP